MMRVGRLLTSVLCATLVVVVAPAATAADQPVGRDVGAALAWLAAEVEALDGQLPGPVGDATDWGLTSDAAIALATDPTRVRTGADAAQQVRDNARSYATFDDQGLDGVLLAGPLAKILIVAQVYDLDTGDADGLDIETALRGQMATSGELVGRFGDTNPHATDAANNFGQALAVTGLADTTAGAPSEAVAFLIDQQCADGGFRTFDRGTRTCQVEDLSDPDTTALAIQALGAVEVTADVTAAIEAGVDFLLDAQDPQSGAIGGSGPTAAPNANSSGLGAQALRANGQETAADAAATYVASLQLQETTGPAAPDAGAIAYNESARDVALAEGVTPQRRDQFRRATSQAALAFTAAPLGDIEAPEPTDPPPGDEPPPPGDGPPEDLPTSVERISGADRIATAIAISRRDLPDGAADEVVLARADDFADALAGTPLALRGGTLLLTWPDLLVHPVAAEIDRVLAPDGVVTLLGGGAALSGDVEAALAQRGIPTRRLAGPDRVETAIAVADALGDVDEVMVTTGFDFPDALSAGTAAAARGAAVLLTTPDVAHPSVAARLAATQPARVWAVGGPAARAFPDAQPLVGATREATAVVVADALFDAPGTIGVARRDDFADALAGGVLAARSDGPLLLTPPDVLATDVAAWACASSVTRAVAFGGTAALTPPVLVDLGAHIDGGACG